APSAGAEKPAVPPVVEPPKPGDAEHAAGGPAPVPAPIAPPPAVAPAPIPTPESGAESPSPPPPAAEAPSPARPAPTPVPAPPPHAQPIAPPAAGESWSDHLRDPIWIGAAVALFLCLGAIALVRRRRRALPNDLDITAIAEEVERTSDTTDTTARIPA